MQAIRIINFTGKKDDYVTVPENEIWKIRSFHQETLKTIRETKDFILGGV